MFNLFTPKWVKNILAQVKNSSMEDLLRMLNKQLQRYKITDPEISIVIPAWNESKNIIPTLLSLADQNTRRKVELIVINNNSTDDTQKILAAAGIKSYLEPTQGISFARQSGLIAASGKFHICADADSLYPPDWINKMIEPLRDPSVTCSYGTYSFIPEGSLNRFGLALFESIANTIFLLRKKRKEYLNVMGFNFAFRKEDGIKVGGFNTSRPRWSDGWMAMELSRIGSIKRVVDKKAVVWTNPRRLMIDGGLIKSFAKRSLKELKVIKEYFIR